MDFFHAFSHEPPARRRLYRQAGRLPHMPRLGNCIRQIQLGLLRSGRLFACNAVSSWSATCLPHRAKPRRPSRKHMTPSVQNRPVPPHRVLHEFYPRPEARASFVRGLFDSSAAHYDWLSRVLSFGSDRFYRRRVLRRAGLKPGMKLLDVATGTGLVAQAALDLGLPKNDILGVDPSAGMLAENRQRHGIPLIQGMGEQLPVADASFDMVTMGYALRHVEDLGRLFAEFHRVLKPGGRVLVLELNKPRSTIGFALMRFYVGRVLPVLIRAVTRRPQPAQLMAYYWVTIAECVPPQTILSALSAQDFIEVGRQQTGSILSEYLATKPTAPGVAPAA